MSAVIFMGLALLFGVGLFAFFIYLLVQMGVNYNPGKRKIQDDLTQLKKDIQPWVNDLVPWDQEDTELFSFNQLYQTLKKRFGSTSAKGVYTSIYHEPMMAYAYKGYSGNKNALLLIRTSHHEFVYRIRPKQIEVWVDGREMGSIQPDGKMYPSQGRKLLAQVNRDTEALQLPVLVGQKEVGRVGKPAQGNKVNQRAFQYISKMDPEEEKVFLAISLLETVQQQL